MPELSVVMPAYNEAPRLEASVREVLAWAADSGVDMEIVLVAEMSPDATQDVARTIASKEPSVTLIENDGRMGKGYTVRRGLLAASGERRAFIDADLDIPVENLSALIERMDRTGHDCVVGLKGQRGRPLMRQALTAGFRIATRIITRVRLRETQCGCKLFTAAFVEDVFPLVKETGFGFDVEALAIGQARGWAMTEAEVTVRQDERTSINVVRDSWDMLLSLFRARRAAGRHAAAVREGR